MNNTNTEKKFNTTVTAFFDAPNFAVKDLKGEDGAAFLSAALDEKALQAINGAVTGSKLLLRKSTKLNKKGGSTYFLEILPPYNGKTATQQIEEGI